VTVEQLTTIEPKDILAIEFTCASCQSRIYFLLAKLQPELFRSHDHRCANCGEKLLTDAQTNRLADLASALQALGQLGTNGVRLEISGSRTP
jgi:DNA-directed RNA polymerase subunit RPC12/RpoP